MSESGNILITGGTSGIGLEVAKSSVNIYKDVSIVGRDFSKVENIGLKANFINCDLSKTHDIIIQDELSYKGIVFSAGIVEYTPIKVLNQAKMYEIFEINYFSSIRLLHSLLANNKIDNGSSIVFVSSISSKIGVPGTLVYSSSKAAIEASVRVLASELSKRKIRVNAVSPGLVHTPFLNSEIFDEKKYSDESKKYPLGIGLPANVSDLIMFLLSDKSSWITGQTITIDGGFSLITK